MVWGIKCQIWVCNFQVFYTIFKWCFRVRLCGGCVVENNNIIPPDVAPMVHPYLNSLQNHTRGNITLLQSLGQQIGKIDLSCSGLHFVSCCLGLFGYIKAHSITKTINMDSKSWWSAKLCGKLHDFKSNFAMPPVNTHCIQ